MRYVIAVIVDGQERARHAIWANSLDEVIKADVFTDQEMTVFATPFADIIVEIKEGNTCD
jgi:hypothetical protein